ncbi:hypothetical protein AVEN_167691-1 [Araneus ventricosus]|uniref:Transposable element Tc1 transposase n=1 Tax=Araneus ventricosus TaxID=182803 RepID=A0A4Y2NMA3_ARAVE|nr:hypothetical protein AVEN_167691-1 [Araneus ventricosus]
MLNKPETYWNNVLFADESKFNIFGSNGHIMVWRRKNEELNPKNLVGTIKYGGGGVLVWGCMSASGLDEICVREVCLSSSPSACEYDYSRPQRTSSGMLGTGRDIREDGFLGILPFTSLEKVVTLNEAAIGMKTMYGFLMEQDNVPNASDNLEKG